MSIVLRLRHAIRNGVHCRHIIMLTRHSNVIKLNLISRSLTQTSLKDDDEEIEIDQRRLPTDYDPSNFDPTEHRSPPTDRVFRLVDEISGLTMIELAELSSILRKKLKMDMPVVGVMKPGTAGMASIGNMATMTSKEVKKPEKTIFELKLESYEVASKIKIIKEVRGFTDLGLKEAKDLVEKAPAIIKSGVSKEDGDKIIEKMKAIGAIVIME